MNKTMVTVVLPIYNVGRYLDRCIASVVGQTHENLEILLVDDGSTDACPAMCDDWAKKDPRIRVIHKQNEGLGMARNTGIENASGEYICFFDSDDYIAPDTVKTALEAAQRHDADVVVFGFTPVKSTGAMGNAKIPHTAKAVYEGAEVADVFLPDLISPGASEENANLWMSACMALFSMKLIRCTGWRFVSERQIISEDVYSLLRLYRYVQRVAVLPKACYFYCENQTSLTHVYRPDRFEKLNQFCVACQAVCEELDYGDEVRARLVHVYFSFVIAALKMAVKVPGVQGRKTTFAAMGDEQLQEIFQKADLRCESGARKILLYAIRQKWFFVAYILLYLKK